MPVRSAARRGRWPGNTPNSPSTLGTVTSSAAMLSARPFGVTISSWILSALTSVAISLGLRELGRLGLHVLDRPHEVEGLLRVLSVVVVLPLEDLLEAVDRVLQGHELPRHAGELRGDEERLRQE